MALFQSEYWPVWGTLLGAFLLMQAFTPLVILLARRMSWVNQPSKDRWHSVPTALMGGIAIYASATLALLVFDPSAVFSPIWMGATFMFLLGFTDDMINVKPLPKLLAQLGAAGFLIYNGHQFAAAWPIWIFIPLTFLWIIGITNAVNLLDNIDGLAGPMC